MQYVIDVLVLLSQKRGCHFSDLILQPSKPQSSGLTSQPWRAEISTNFFYGHNLQLAPATLWRGQSKRSDISQI